MNRYETISCVFNEEFLLPYYFKHYDFCDRFNILYDIDSTDNTLDILRNNPKVNLIPFEFPDGMDEALKIKFINYIYSGISDAWVLNLDIDEFIFFDKKYITEPINTVKFFHVFRHVTEKDLDINLPIKEQRRHGYLEEIYQKPIIVKSGQSIQWEVGNHALKGRNKPASTFIGAHWANADISFCVDRRVKNRSLRQSKVNLTNKWTVQHHNITEADVIKQCKEHENDPQVF